MLQWSNHLAPRARTLATLGCLAVVAGCASPGVVSRPDAVAGADIRWSARRPLTWSDFRGPVDAAPGERVAMTAATLRWSYEYSLERDGNVCEYWVKTVRSEAVFNPADSWVRPGYSTDAILRHEQSHFDLTEVFKRELDARTAGLVGARSGCSGATLTQAVQSAERGAAAKVQSIFDDVWNSYVAAQSLYDSQTQHGTLGDVQAVWSRAVTDALRTGRWQAPR